MSGTVKYRCKGRVQAKKKKRGVDDDNDDDDHGEHT